MQYLTLKYLITTIHSIRCLLNIYVPRAIHLKVIKRDKVSSILAFIDYTRQCLNFKKAIPELYFIALE